MPRLVVGDITEIAALHACNPGDASHDAEFTGLYVNRTEAVALPVTDHSAPILPSSSQ